MNKKAYSIVINLVFIGILLWFIFSKFMPIIAPLFNNDKNTVGYENFEVLNWKIQRLLNDETIEKSDTMFFEMEKGFTMIAFDKNDEGIITCLPLSKQPRSEEVFYKKPDICEGKACICLFKDLTAKKTNNIDEQVANCKKYDGEIKFYTFLTKENFFLGCDKTNEYPVGNSYPIRSLEEKYESIYFNIPSDKSKFVENFYIEVQNHYAINHVVIGRENENTEQIRSNFINKCPQESVTWCKDEQFNKVVYDEENEYYYCRFDENENVCVKGTNLEICDADLIENGFCDCGGIAYNYGYCIGGVFQTRINEPCNQLNDCTNYKDPLNCRYDSCDKGGCYMELTEQGCKSCSDFNSCKDYGSNQAFCEQDICGVTKRRIQAPGHECVFSSGSCEDYFSSNLNFDTPVNAQECYEKNSPSVYDYSNNECKDCSSYASYTTRCKSNSFNANSRCDFYNEMNPSDNAQRKADPCDCDGDEKFPDDVCA